MRFDMSDDSHAVNHSTRLAALKAVEAKGIKNPDLFNDIGLANYHLNRPAQANLYFLKALNLILSSGGCTQSRFRMPVEPGS
jgi:hypothetical protein